jgi:hypothetical protein
VANGRYMLKVKIKPPDKNARGPGGKEGMRRRLRIHHTLSCLFFQEVPPPLLFEHPIQERTDKK